MFNNQQPATWISQLFLVSVMLFFATGSWWVEEIGRYSRFYKPLDKFRPKVVTSRSELKANCGSNTNFTNLFGKIGFPSIGNQYSNNVECRWSINVAPNILRVEINDVNMEYHDKCGIDYVAFYDDPAYQNEISRYCSNKKVVFFHKTGMLYIKIVTDNSASASGFILSWISTTAESSQVFASPKIKNETYFSVIPYYAEKSNALFKCEASGVPAPFVYWDYHKKISENCIFIENGFNSSYLKVVNCLNSLRKKFSCHAASIAGTDEKVMDMNIAELYANCGSNTNFTNLFGKIGFPSIGNKYSDNIECRWSINVAPNILRVEINDVNMEYHDKCGIDYVAFYDDPAYQNEISRYCSNKQVVFFHKTGILYIKVVTDNSASASGFNLSWISTTAENSQVLASPKIKNETYFSVIPYYAEKSNALFKCEASGVPAPFVYWDYHKKISENCIFIENGFNSSYLKVVNCLNSLRKKFSCHAASIAGTDEKVMDRYIAD